MADNLVQVSLNHDSALPEDVTVNTWSIFTATAKDTTAIEAAVNAIQAFYASIQTYLSGNLSGAGTVKAYDRADVAPRVPWYEDTMGFTPGTAAALPEEVAFCLSFQAAAASGSPQARRRGRVYLGPLGANAGGNGFAANRPVAAFMTAVAGAADTLLAASNAAADWNWNVWSEVDGLGRPVTNGWVDNAFDTQRRRGLAPTSRTLFDG
jgi:hypothetical protein